MGNARDILRRTLRGYFALGIAGRAAALTYYLLFAIFPFLIALISLLGFLHLPMISFEGEAAAFLPEDVIALLNLTIAHMTEATNGATLTFGLLFSFWFPYRAVKGMTDAVADIYGGGRPARHGLRVILLSVFILFLIPAMVILLLIGGSVLEFVARFLPITGEFIDLWTKLRFLPMAAVLLLLNAAVYYLSPNVPPAPRYILPGAVLAAGASMAFSVVFSYYVDNMGRYSVIYGSIGAIIAFLIWLNWMQMALLLGALFNQARRAAAEGEKLRAL